MKKNLSRRIELLSLACIAIISFALCSPTVCHGEEYGLRVDFSPNIINISSERLGEIRVFTNTRYSVPVLCIGTLTLMGPPFEFLP